MSGVNIKMMNDVAEVYEQEPKIIDGKRVCPACGKMFKTESGYKSHIAKRECFNYLTLVKDTLLEVRIYDTYKKLIAALNPKARSSLTKFRKSKYYNPIARFVLFCIVHEIKDQDLYLEWINQKLKATTINAILSKGIKETNLRNFRLFLQVNEDNIKSKEYYERYEKDLKSDANFLTRSLEKSLISFKYLAERQDFYFEQTMESLPIDYQHRLASLMEEVILAKGILR